MWIPEVIFCIAAQCWLVTSPAQPTEELCEAFLLAKTVPTILAHTPPGTLIHTIRCTIPGTPT